MTYRFNGQEYDEEDFDDMSDEELKELKQWAEKFARDTTILINRKKLEWEKSGRNPNYGLSPQEFNAAKAEREEAFGLIDTIKALGI
jgi:hypothetical protein